MNPTPSAPPSFYRTDERPGLWPHRGKVVAVGIGHSPTARRWDGRAETSVGAWALTALRNAMADAGIKADQVDGLVMDPSTTTGAWWPEGESLPEDVISQFKPGVDPLDGIGRLSAEWILANMPELSNVGFTMYGAHCMTNCLCVASEVVGRGLADTVLVLKAWHNFPGRYYHGGANAKDTVEGAAVWSTPWGITAATIEAWTFREYMHKYGKTHDMMAPFIVNSKRNGLLFPEGFFAQHRPDVITTEDYLNARPVVEPLNLLDHDLPIQIAVAYVFTTAERAADMRQKPVYIINHASTRLATALRHTLEEAEASTDSTARKLLDGTGFGPDDYDIENFYDGFATKHIYMVEGLGYRGMKRGEALDFFAGDISIEGPNPTSPSGGNVGSGRTRCWMHTDCIQQLQGRAGARQVHLKNGRPEVAVSGGQGPEGGEFIVWGATPD